MRSLRTTEARRQQGLGGPGLAADAQDIAGWVSSADEARWWGGHTVAWPVDPSISCAWHADADVQPFVLRKEGALLAYGEVWVDDDEQEVELGRIIVRPERRGRGVGRLVVSRLLDQARRPAIAEPSCAWRRRMRRLASATRQRASCRSPPTSSGHSTRDSPSSTCGCGMTWDRRPLPNDGDGYGARIAVHPACAGVLMTELEKSQDGVRCSIPPASCGSVRSGLAAARQRSPLRAPRSGSGRRPRRTRAASRRSARPCTGRAAPRS